MLNVHVLSTTTTAIYIRVDRSNLLSSFELQSLKMFVACIIASINTVFTAAYKCSSMLQPLCANVHRLHQFHLTCRRPSLDTNRLVIAMLKLTLTASRHLDHLHLVHPGTKTPVACVIDVQQV